MTTMLLLLSSTMDLECARLDLLVMMLHEPCFLPSSEGQDIRLEHFLIPLIPLLFSTFYLFLGDVVKVKSVVMAVAGGEKGKWLEREWACPGDFLFPSLPSPFPFLSLSVKADILLATTSTQFHD